MGLIHKILDRINILSVVFSDAENYTMMLTEYRFRKKETESRESEVTEIGGIRKKLTGFPLIVTISGYGVISKEISSAGDIADKVKATGSGFLWAECGDTISFVRERQIEKLKHDLGGSKAKTVSEQCIPQGHASEDLKAIATQWHSDTLHMGLIFKPSPYGSALAVLTASKLKLPVLGFILIALMINTLSSSKVQARHEHARTELEAMRKSIGRTDEATRRQQELVSEYSYSLPYDIWFICDRIGMSVPDKIILTSLAVQPPLRQLEENKKIGFAHDQIMISGESSASEPVSEYVSALFELCFSSQVRLTSMEQDRDRDLFNFKITIDL